MREHDDYYARRLEWLEQTLDRLGCAEIEPEPEVPDDHRKELQEIAAGLQGSIAIERRAGYHPPGQDGTVVLAQSFRAHFPRVARMLDEWDVLHDEIWAARHAVWDWEANNWNDRASPGMPGLVVSDAIEYGGNTLPWTEAADYLMLPGVGMLKLGEGVDLNAFKRPYDDFLAEALGTQEAATLRQLRLRIDDATGLIHQELQLIRSMHVIRGRCELCR